MSTTANITVYKNGVTLAPVVHRVKLITGGAAAHNASASAHAGLFDPAGSALTAQAAAIAAAHALVDDLSGVNDAATARSNLGLGSAAVEDTSAFDAAGAATSAQAAAESYADGQIAALNLGTAAQADAGDFDAAGSAATAEAAAKSYADGLATNYDPAGSAAAVASDLAAHEGLTDGTHGISAYGATLIDDADASAARATLGLGTIATAAVTDYVPATGGTFSGDLTVTGEASLGNGALTVDDVTGDVDVSGDLTATGNPNFSGITNQFVIQGTGNTIIDLQAPAGNRPQTWYTIDGTVEFRAGALDSSTFKFTPGTLASVLGLTIKDTGFVGINKNSPDTELHVSGDATVDSDLAVAGDIDAGGIIDYTGTMGDSTLDPTTDAPADWVEIAIGGTTYYIPAYAAS